MPRWPGGKSERPYGLWFRLKGTTGPIRTERWYANRSDRDRAFASLKDEHGTKMLSSGKIQR